MAATSGPGRAPASDGRIRHRRPPARGRARDRQASAELRRRAEALFPGRAEEAFPEPAEEVFPEPAEAAFPEPAEAPIPERAVEWRESGAGPPESPVGDEERQRPGDAWRVRAGLALRERMPVWLQTRCGLERRSVVALGVVLVVAAVFAVQHFWTGRTQSVPAPEVVRAAAPLGEWEGRASGEPAAEASGGMSGGMRGGVRGGLPGAGASPGPEIVVDVSGKVRHPGIHRLPAGSRVDDALRAAGGVRPGTSTEGLNRARFLVDGEQVVVGGPAAPAPGPAGAAGSAPGAGAAGGGVPGAGAPAAPVSLNTATVDQLDTLPGVGPVLAQHIVAYRTQHGGFRSVDELREVNGIGDRRFADLRDLVRP